MRRIRVSRVGRNAADESSSAKASGPAALAGFSRHRYFYHRIWRNFCAQDPAGTRVAGLRAERSQANAAGYLAEQVSARLGEVRYALSVASSDFSALPDTDIERVAETRLTAMMQSELLDGIGLLLPDGRTFTAGAPVQGQTMRELTRIA